MNSKNKVFFVFLAVLAVFSVLSFSDILRGIHSANLSNTLKSSALSGQGDDIDNDGLSNVEESYWNTNFQNPDSDSDGFLDGEEVASGHDPSVKGPDDALIESNLTQKLANLTLGGVMEGSLKSDSPDYDKSVNALTLSIVDDGLISFNPEISLSDLKTIDPTKESKDIYIAQIDSVLEKLYKALSQETKEIGAKLELVNNGGMSNPQFIEYFISQREIFNAIAKEILQIPVPADLLNKHASFINYILTLSKVNDSLAKGKDDPIRATVGFNLFIGLVEDFSTVIQSSFLEN